MLVILKEKDEFFKPLAKAMPKWLHPNVLTLARFLFIPGIVALVLVDQIALATLLAMFGFFIDALDGTLARLRHQQTEFGAVLDPLADIGLFLAAFIMIGVPLLPFNLILANIVLETVITVGSAFFFVIFMAMGVKRNVGASIYGKIKAIFQMIALLMLGFGHDVTWIVSAATILFWFSLFLRVTSMVGYTFAESNSDSD